MAKGISINIAVATARVDCCGGATLPEAENGARMMAEIAGMQGFDVVGPLLTGAAKRPIVEAAIRSAATKLGSGDMLLLTYTGHGCRIFDQLPIDERDEYDEAWCLPDEQLRDDRLHELLAEFQEGVRILVVSDSCYSGSIVTFNKHGRIEPIHPDRLAVLGENRERTRVDGLLADSRCQPPAEIEKLRLRLSRSRAKIRASVLLIASCTEIEEARDGLFSSKLKQIWAGGAFQETYVELISRLHGLVSNENSSQHPGWTCLGAFDPAFLRQRPFTISEAVDLRMQPALAADVEHAPTDPHRLDEISAQLSRIELLLVGSLPDGEERNEPPEPAAGESLHAERTAAAAKVPSPAQRFEQFIDRLGFPSFRGSEFTPYWTRVRNGVRNSVPPEELWDDILRTLAVLQRFRDEIGSPVRLLSTYRSEAYNDAVEGAGGSQHTRFRAIDFTVVSGTPAQWAVRLKGFRGRTFRHPGTADTFEFHGGIGVYPGSHFVHLDTRGVDRDW